MAANEKLKNEREQMLETKIQIIKSNEKTLTKMAKLNP